MLMENRHKGNRAALEHCGAKLVKEVARNEGELIRIWFMPGTVSLDALPPRSVALDGVVRGPQQGSDSKWSFDHHDGCLRLATLATCEQVYLATRLGNGAFWNGRDIIINDFDGDVVTSLWLIVNSDNRKLIESAGVRSLVRGVGAIDAHGPIGISLLDALERKLGMKLHNRADELLGRPNDNLRSSLRKEPSLGMKQVDGIFEHIKDILNNTDDTTSVRLEKAPVEASATHLAHGHTFVLGESEGDGFDTLYDVGVSGGVVYKKVEGGGYNYTIARKSDLVEEFPVQTILRALNAKEEGWGGGSSIGGSPMIESGSRLSPEEVWKVVVAAVEGLDDF